MRASDFRPEFADTRVVEHAVDPIPGARVELDRKLSNLRNRPRDETGAPAHLPGR